MGAVLIMLCSWLSVPATVSFTMQTFAVFMLCDLLGGAAGLMSVLLYVLLGALGLPVFAGFNSGIGTLLGPTGGYIMGFFLTAAVMLLQQKHLPDKALWRIAGMVAGLFVCYLFGTVWFLIVYAQRGTPITLMTALGWCVFPFIIPDLIKIALAFLISGRVKRALRAQRLL